jgi:hypothetical protein
MNPLTLLLLGAALYTPLSGLAEETEPAAATLVTTLEELGYPDGLTFDGSTQPSERTLLFHLPKGMSVNSATLRIVYRGSPQLGSGASLIAVINEQPPQMIEVKADKQTREWQIPVPASELAGGQLKVALSSNIPVDYDTIIDGEPQNGFVHVASETDLTSSVAGVPGSLRDAWLTLPDDVVVTIPRGALNETAFRATLDWVTLLQRSRHTVRITTLPELGDLVIAPEADIVAALAYLTGQPAESRTLWSKKGNNIGLVGFKGKAFIAVTQPYADAARFASSWQELSQSSYIETTPLTVDGGDVETIPLDVRGLSTAPALLGHKLQWRATLTPWNLPPGTRPVSTTLKMKVPHTEPQETFRLFIYLNDKMVVSERFSGDGLNREIVVPFDDVPRADSYRLRLVVRDSGVRDGSQPTILYPFLISPQSHATLERASQTPEGFSSVPSSLGHGFDLYVPREYLGTAPRYLARIGQLLAGFVVPSTEYKIVMLEPGQIPAPHRSFIVAGDTPPAGATLPVRFDEGKVQLINSRGERLIEERRLRSASVVQLIDSDDAIGLWFHPGEHEKLPVIDANILGSDDVAVYEPDQLALSMNSHHKDLVRPQYLESPRWHERLYNQRVMWLQFGWGLLTIVVVYLYLKSRQHRNG